MYEYAASLIAQGNEVRPEVSYVLHYVKIFRVPVLKLLSSFILFLVASECLMLMKSAHTQIANQWFTLCQNISSPCSEIIVFLYSVPCGLRVSDVNEICPHPNRKPMDYSVPSQTFYFVQHNIATVFGIMDFPVHSVMFYSVSTADVLHHG